MRRDEPGCGEGLRIFLLETYCKWRLKGGLCVLVLGRKKMESDKSNYGTAHTIL
jgi:hypothetical protein